MRRTVAKLCLSHVLILAAALVVTLAMPAVADSDAPSSSSSAGPPPAANTDAISADFVEVFSAPCLMRFPDDAAVESYAKDKNLTPLTQAEVHRLLGSDPGVGWIQQTSFGTYILTIEKPPFHTCAIRKEYEELPNFRPLYSLALSLWAASRKTVNLKAQPPQSFQAGVEGLPTDAYLYDLTGPNPRDREQLMALVTKTPRQTYGVRLVRQFPPPN